MTLKQIAEELESLHPDCNEMWALDVTRYILDREEKIRNEMANPKKTDGGLPQVRAQDDPSEFTDGFNFRSPLDSPSTVGLDNGKKEGEVGHEGR